MSRTIITAVLCALPLAAPAATLSWVSDTDHPEHIITGPVNGVDILTPSDSFGWNDSLYTARGLNHPDPGLGVCRGDCDDDGADSISYAEWVALDFGGPVDITRLAINWTPAAYTTIGGSQAVLNHAPWTGALETSAGTLDVLDGIWEGSILTDLLRIEGWNAFGDPEAAIYLGSVTWKDAPAPIPVPAAAWLLGAALAGLVGLKWGRRG